MKINRFEKKRLDNSKFGFLIPFIIICLVFIVVPFLMIFTKSFLPTTSGPAALNWSYMDSYIWKKILQSFTIAVITTIMSLLIAYPFCYFLAYNTKSKITKTVVILLISAPIWMSFLVKIVGLKTLFDAINGYQNSTYGNIFTIIGLVYAYLPFMILPIYNTMNSMPNNLIFASKDLGKNTLTTIFKVVMPYTKAAIIGGITLVFLPALTTVAVPQFLNASSSGTMIGDIIMEEGNMGLNSDISLARASTLSLLMILIIGATIVAYYTSRKITNVILKKKRENYAK